MTFTIQMICTEQGRPKKIVEVNEESLAKNPGPIDNMNDAFMTRFSPFRILSKGKMRPKKPQNKIVVNGILEFHLQ